MGDAKLGFLLGLALGSKTIGAALIAFAGLLVAALYVLATRGVSARKDAIPFGMVTAQAQDARGMLWLGTQNGVVRYDGYRFHPNSSSPNSTRTYSSRLPHL